MSKGFDSKEHQQEEIHAIRQTIAEMESAFNTHDADELDLHFTLNATWVNVFGKKLSGWKQINETHQILLAGPLHNSYACYTVESITFIRSDVAIALAKAYIRPDDRMIEPFGIYHNEKMVGFFNLHYEPDCQKDFWLFHFFIDKRYQRKGFGAAAITELINHLKIVHPSCHLIRLTVHPENNSGQKFYSNLGFTDDEILTYGERTYSLYI